MSRKKLDCSIPEENPLYHNTYLLLKLYRDANWSLELSSQQLRKRFELEYGQSVDDFLDSIYCAGADLGGTDIEGQARAMQRTQKMLRLVNDAVDLMRCKHKHGEVYYWLLYFTFLSPQELNTAEDIMSSLRPYVKSISRRTYYQYRREAIDTLGGLLWGYTSTQSMAVLNEFVLTHSE